MKSFFKKIPLEIVFILLFTFSRFPDLGHDFFNTDVWKWKSRIYDFGTGVFTLNFEKTLQKYHPGVTLMWLGTAGVKVYNLYYDVFLGMPPLDNSITTIFELHFVQNLFIVLALGLTLMFVFYVLRKLYGTFFAALCLFIISLEPFYLALSRAMHLEALLSTLMLASFFWFLFFLSDTSKHKRLHISAFFAGLSVLTKTSALFIVPFVLILFLMHCGGSLKKFQTHLKFFIWWFFTFTLTFFVLWPSMWVQPVKTVTELFRGVSEIGIETEHQQYYFGNLVEDPGLSYYIVVFALRSSALVFLTSLIALTTFKKLSEDRKKLVVYILAYSLLYLFVMSIPSKKLDRYILPSLMGFCVISSVIIEYFVKTYLKRFSHTVMALVFIVVLQIGTAIYIHPDYLSFYNPLFGGLRVGVFVLEPKWLIGQRQITEYFIAMKHTRNLQEFHEGESLDALLNKPEITKKLTVAFPEKYYTQVWPFIREIGGWATIGDIDDFARNSRFFVFPVWSDTSENVSDVEFSGTIKLHGVALYNVYERTQ